MLDKIEREYKEKYGHIPTDWMERLDYYIAELKIKKHKGDVFSKINKVLEMTWSTLEFHIYLEPKATPRPRHSIKANIFYVKDASNNRKRFRKFMDGLDISMIRTSTKFTCVSYFPIPSSMTKIERLLAELGFIRPMSKPDWDNIGKTYSDMIQEQLLYDDSLIIEGNVKKFYSCKPRVEITVEYMDDFDSSYNEKKILNKKEKE